MITTKIDIKPHLAEFIRGKYAQIIDNRTVVLFPDKTHIYHFIYDLLEKRPVNASRDIGNVEIALPDRRDGDIAGGKPPERYNYLGARSQKLIGRQIETMMWAELHTLLDENKHRHAIDFIDSVHIFMKKYMIESISEDGLLKNYQRWQYELRRKSKRSYNRRSV